MTPFWRGFCRGYAQVGLVLIYPIIFIAPVIVFYPWLVKRGHAVWKELWDEA